MMNGIELSGAMRNKRGSREKESEVEGAIM